MDIKHFSDQNKDRTMTSWNAARSISPLSTPAVSTIDDGIAAFRLHDHISLLYESAEEWRTVIVKYIAAGIEHGERCFYVHDAYTPEQIKSYLTDAGVDVAQAEKANLLYFLEEAELYTQDGSFEPDRVITRLINETQKAVRDGHPGIRLTSEMSWSLHGYAGAEKIIEFESKLNRDFLPQYSCMILCQYARAQFDAAVIRDVITTHPILIYGGRVYQNRYYVPPDEVLLHKDPRRNVQRMLDTIIREDSVEQWMKFLNDVFDRSEQPFVAFYPDDRLITWNQAFSKLLGYSGDDLKTHSYQELTPERWRGMDMLMAEKLRQTGTAQHYQKELIRKDGAIIPVEISLQQVLDDDDNVLYNWTFISEISQQKPAEATAAQSAEKSEDERLYRVIFNQISNGAIVLELIYNYTGKPVDFRIIEINTAAEHAFEVKATDAVGMTAKQLPKFADFLQILEPLHNAATTENPVQIDDFHALNLDKHFEMTLSCPEKGRCLATFIDSTAKVKTIEKIQRSEDKLRFAMETSGEGMWDWDIPTGYADYSPAWARILGYDIKDVPKTYEFWESGIHPDERSRVLDALNEVFDDAKPSFSVEHRLRTKDGNWQWVLLRSRIMEWSAEGMPKRIIGTLTDISIVKQMAEQLQEQLESSQDNNRTLIGEMGRLNEQVSAEQEKFRTVFNRSLNPLFITDESGHFIEANETALRFFECSREELLAKQIGDFDPLELKEKQQQERESAIQGQITEYSCMTGSAMKTMLLTIIPIQSGATLSLFWTGHDITAMKMSMEQLRESEMRFKTIYESSPVPAVLCNGVGTAIVANNSYLSLFGISEIIQQNMFDTLNIADSIRENVFAGETARLEIPFDFDVDRNRGLLASSKTGAAWFDVLITPLQKYDGTVLNGFLMQLIDITNEKAERVSLRDSEALFRNLGENIPAIAYSTSADEIRTVIFLSDKIIELTGYTRDEFIADPSLWSNMIHNDDRQQALEKRAVFIARKEPFDLEFRITTKSGEIKWVRDKACPGLNESGDIVRIDGFMEDISGRKHSENEMELIRTQLLSERDIARRYLDVAGIAVLVCDKDAIIKLVNREAYRLFGYEEQELIGQQYIAVLMDPDKQDEYRQSNTRWMEGEPPPPSLESIFVTKSGDKRTMQWHPAIIRDNQGTTTGSIICVLDITERKQTEHELGLRALTLDKAAGWIILTDFGGNILYANEAALSARGYTREEFLQMNILQDMEPAFAALIDVQMNDLKEKGSLTFETAYRRGNDLIFVEAHARTLRLDDEDHILLVCHDITARKLAEEELKSEKTEAWQYLNNAGVIIMATNREGKVTWINNRGCEVFNREKTTLIGSDFTEIIPPEDRDRVKFEYDSYMEDKEPPDSNEQTAETGQGEQRLIRWHNVLLRDTQGTATGMLLSGYDITDQRQKENSLLLAEERYRTLFNSVSSALLVIDRDGTVITASAATVRMFGYSSDEIQGNRQWMTRIQPGNLETVFRDNKIMEMTSESSPVSFEIKVADKKGADRSIIASVAMVPETTRYLVSLIDITDMKKTGHELRPLYDDIVEQAVQGIMQMTAKGRILMANAALARMLGYESPAEMISKVKNVAEKLMTDHQRWQKFVRLLRSQGMLASFETEFFCKDESRLWVQVSARIVYDQRSGRIHYFETFIEDISHRKKVEMDISHILETQEKALTNTIQTISKISEIRDPYTAGHQRRVTQLAVAIAREMQLEQPLIEALNTASMLHDIGKAYVPAEILTKPGKLSDAEMRLVRNHPATGYDIVRQINFQKPIADIILQHHERLDGSGYPHGLKGDAIIKEARILAVADVVEAMATVRPFRTEYGIEIALEEIENNRGILYDPEAVDACLRLCRHKGFVFSMF